MLGDTTSPIDNDTLGVEVEADIYCEKQVDEGENHRCE
jgi:hypothetical protein